ncbi:hypothetical protein HAX54_004430 [Datura stramonium]|uniref:Uncharacterized protein n=1 Tax=Datura stramonium TaxID=4076 RepID=A0ABS8T891_DATST|nr:hypothetical protein [Datura stramonium]
MDSIFSPKHHTLSLVSCSPISSSLVPRRLRPPSLRHQFLSGSTHYLRPPGLRSRRRCQNVGFQFGAHTSRFVLRASFDSQAVVVVASVVTISALTIVFFEFSKRNANAKKFKEENLQGTKMSSILTTEEVRAPGPVAHTESDAVPSSFVEELNNIFLQEHLNGTKMSNILTTEEVRAPGPIAHTESDAVPSSFVEESNSVYLQEHLHETKISNILTTEEVVQA